MPPRVTEQLFGSLVHHLDLASAIENHLTAHASALVGQNFLGLLPPPIAHHAMHAVGEALNTGVTQSFGCHHLVLGKPCDFEVRVAKCREEEVVALVRDVTERKLLEKEILDWRNVGTMPGTTSSSPGGGRTRSMRRSRGASA